MLVERFTVARWSIAAALYCSVYAMDVVTEALLFDFQWTEAITVTTSCLGAQLAVLLPSLFVLRMAGYRLVRQESRVPGGDR